MDDMPSIAKPVSSGADQSHADRFADTDRLMRPAMFRHIIHPRMKERTRADRMDGILDGAAQPWHKWTLKARETIRNRRMRYAPQTSVSGVR